MEMLAVVNEEIPTDEEVLDIVKGHPNGIGGIELLEALLKTGHTRANAQRAMQRCLDRGKIKLDLNLMVLPQLAMAA